MSSLAEPPQVLKTFLLKYWNLEAVFLNLLQPFCARQAEMMLGHEGKDINTEVSKSRCVPRDSVLVKMLFTGSKTKALLLLWHCVPRTALVIAQLITTCFVLHDQEVQILSWRKMKKSSYIHRERKRNVSHQLAETDICSKLGVTKPMATGYDQAWSLLQTRLRVWNNIILGNKHFIGHLFQLW